MLKIRILGKKVKFAMDLSHKVNLISDNSATGKTRLVKALFDLSGAYSTTIVHTVNGNSESLTDRQVQRLDSRNWEILMSAEYDTVMLFVVDDEDFVKTTEFAKILNSKKNAYFLFMLRTFDFISNQSGYSISTEAIYAMERYEEWFRVKPLYDCFKSPTTLESTCILVEDEGSGYTFFKAMFPKVDVYTYKGRDNILNYICDNKTTWKYFRNVILFMDIAGAGFRLKAAKDYLEVLGCNVYIFQSYKSFEYLLLQSNMFTDVNLDDYNNLEYTSDEKMYEDILVEKTRGKAYSYSKNADLKNCYYCNCCTERRDTAPCDRGLSGNKFSVLLKGTEFNELLKLGGY